MRHWSIWAGLCVLLLAGTAQALITGMVGNAPTRDQDWPAGTLELANQPNRLGFWEGPPFGGGEYHFLYRGDTAAFQFALDLFAKIKAPELRLVVNEGQEESFWLKTSGKEGEDARVDWTLVVWTPRNFMQIYNNPRSTFMSRDPSGAYGNAMPPPTLIVNVAGAEGKGIDWSKLKVPAGLTVKDNRATTAGYTREDRSVVRGDVFDMKTSKPLAGAVITIGKLKEKTYETVLEGKADENGHFEIKKVPEGAYRVSAAAESHVARVLAYESFGTNTFKQYAVQLLPPMEVRGTVRMPDDKPLGAVKLSVDGVIGMDGRGYLLASGAEAESDGLGKFEIEGVPEGYFQLYARLENYQQVDSLKLLGGMVSTIPSMSNGATEIIVRMTGTGKLKGRVLKQDGTPDAKANIQVNPPGKAADRVGHWGGGKAVKPDGTFEFEGVPPGQYVLSTNLVKSLEGNDPDAVTVEVKVGETTDVEIKSRGR